jgi:hypothetical protein
METFKVAHIHEQGNDIIIVIVNPSFRFMPHEEQNAGINVLQACATSAGLAGIVVPVWQDGNTFGCLPPTKWLPFFESLTWPDILRNINGELRCG